MSRSGNWLPRMPGLPGAAKAKDRLRTGTADPAILNLLHEAIGERLHISATYLDEDGTIDQHTFFPLELGRKGREARVWAYQTTGDSGSGERCFVVGRLSDVTAQATAWVVPVDLADSRRCFAVER